jgi:hypothetical protein
MYEMEKKIEKLENNKRKFDSSVETKKKIILGKQNISLTRLNRYRYRSVLLSIIIINITSIRIVCSK